MPRGHRKTARERLQTVALWGVLVIALTAVLVVRIGFAGAVADAISAALEALFIAAFLALTVDPYLKKEFFREASTDIFFFWLGYALPHEVGDYLQTFIMDTKLVRRECELRWNLRELDTGKVELKLRVSFILQNVTNQRQDYQLGGSIFGGAAQERVLEMRCDAPGLKELEYVWGPRDFQATSDGWLLGPHCSIPPQATLDREKRGDIRFSILYASLHEPDGSDVWMTGAPTINVKVICEPADRFRFSINQEGAELVGPGQWELKGIRLKDSVVGISWQRLTEGHELDEAPSP